jgi:hypothetical protein
MANKIGRNQPCTCGSGLKYKRCHGRYVSQSPAGPPFLPSDMQHVLERNRASERIRKKQQGLGRPIVAFKSGDHQVVAVRNTVYFSDKWKTFPDFLADYIKQKIGSDWGNAEIAKLLDERHPLMQWYDTYCRYQQATIRTPGVTTSAKVTGVVACYLGLAYSLYLLDHNVELQQRLINRLKDPSNFQGAFYELIIANVLIRAGFELTLEDETDPASKHCEFAAVSRRTRKKYWVEAKMRSVAGRLGKTTKDGGPDAKPISRLIPHLNAALAKPAADERLIFIDLNAEHELDGDGKPTWHHPAIARLLRYETKELTLGVKAYLFVTNMAFHRRLADTPVIAAAPFGLGIPDFNRPGYYRVSDVYRHKQKHVDAYNIGDAISEYARFPSTFDGSLPSEAFGAGQSNRVMIGETYFFEAIGPKGLVGTVTTATVNQQEKAVYIGVSAQDGTSQILRQPISDADLADYKAHPDAYFGKIVPVSKKIEDRYEFFEGLIAAYKGLSRTALLERLAKAPHFETLKKMSDSDLLAEYCECMAAAFEASGFTTKPKKDLG